MREGEMVCISDVILREGCNVTSCIKTQCMTV